MKVQNIMDIKNYLNSLKDYSDSTIKKVKKQLLNDFEEER